VIGGEDGEHRVAIQLGDAKQRVQQAGRGTAISGLDDETAGRQIGHERSIVGFVGARHDHHLLVAATEQVHAPAGAVQQRVAVQQGAELLRPRVPADTAGERPQTRTVASGEDQRPRRRW
jgi:hypothetical protein